MGKEEKRHFCTYEGCTASFGRPYRLEQHLRVHTGERPFKCEQCDQSYTRASHLKRHVSTTHNDTTPVVPTFLCTIDGCGMQLTTEQNLRKHHQRMHSTDRLKCETCGEVFKKNQSLKIHEYKHTGIKPFQCDFEGCGLRFMLPSVLKGHAKTHNGYTCDAEGCKEEFTLWSLLVKHKAEAHPKVYKCQVCDKSYKRPFDLRKHSKVHQSKREVFHCPTEGCPTWSYNENYLKLHIERTHVNPVQYTCNVEGCGQIFSWKKSLVKHAASHGESKESEEPKVEPNRPKKPRIDKGKPKKALAAILSGCPLSKEDNERILLRAVE